MRNKIDDEDFKAIGEELGLSPSEVKKIVHSFFGSFVSSARKLPFNNERKIYSRAAFLEYSFAQNIPFIGRIGTSYSKYLGWRGNESKNLKQVVRSKCRDGYTQEEIEAIALDVLSGRTPQLVNKHKSREFYNKIWMVDKGKKRLARQAILKEEK